MGLEAIDDALQRVGRQVRVFGNAGGLLRVVEDRVELLALHLQHDVREHHDESAVGVVSESLVAGCVDKTAQRRGVQAEVEYRVHHARHRELCAAPHGYEQWRCRIAELLARRLFDRRERRLHFVHHAGRELHARCGVGVARFGRHRESGRDGQAHVRHLGKVRALAAEQGLLILVPFVEQVDVLLRHDVSMVFERIGAEVARRAARPASARLLVKNGATYETTPKLRIASVERPE